MLNRIETTDPITRRDVSDLQGRPFVVDKGSEEQLTIYFESEETKRQYLDIPVEHPIQHRLNLSITQPT
jgi:hypothetical protein